MQGKRQPPRAIYSTGHPTSTHLLHYCDAADSSITQSYITKMPRSFLVKKHLTNKKPNYGILDSKADGTVNFKNLLKLYVSIVVLYILIYSSYIYFFKYQCEYLCYFVCWHYFRKKIIFILFHS